MKEAHFKSHNVIKVAYLAWSLLYVIETLVSVYYPTTQQVLAEMRDLAGIIPEQEITEIYGLVNSANIFLATVVILGGWPFVIWLPKDEPWVFFTFLSSCYLSAAVNVWTILFTGEINSFTGSKGLQFAYLTLLVIMINFAYRLRREIGAQRSKVQPPI